MENGIAPRRATYNTLKKLGGINAVLSASHVPTICQAYEISRSLKPKNEDPLKKLIEKQQGDGCTEHSIIEKIERNQFSYDTVLFNKRVIKNIANFCCTDRKEVKSALCWDFTFDIGKSPPYYLLALSYQNTTLFNKTTKHCPVMVGPVLICHKKDEKVVTLLCDTLLDASRGLTTDIKVLGTDGKNNILNQACNAFPCAMLLL